MKIRNVIILAIVLVVATFFATQAFFQGSALSFSLDQNKAQQLINKTTHDSVKVVKHFPAIGNLEGYVVTSKDNTTPMGIIYYDKAYNYLVSGVIIDGNGENVVQRDYAEFIQPDAAKKAAKNLDNTFTILQGQAGAPHKAYAVVDPNCIFCNQLYKMLAPKIQAGDLAVKWIVVGIVKPSSKGKALAILGADQPLQALETNEKGFVADQEEGGITPMDSPSDIAKERLQKNTEFILQNGFNATPVIMYKDTSGDFQVVSGLPKKDKLDAVINKMSNSF